jgi:hypothetical protein
VYLRIVRLARLNSNWVREKDIQPLLPGLRLETWVIALAKLGYYWEATEILYEMVHLFSLGEAKACSQRLLRTVQAANLSKADQLAEISALWTYSSVVARIHNIAARPDQLRSQDQVVQVRSQVQRHVRQVRFQVQVRSQVTELFMAIQTAEVLKEYRQSCKQYFKWAELALYIGFDDPSPPRLSELLRTAADAGDFGSFWDLADDGYGLTISGSRSWLKGNGQPHKPLSEYDHVSKKVLGDQLQHLQGLNSKLSSCPTVAPSPEVVAFVRDTLAKCEVFDTAFPLSSTAILTTHQFRVPRIRYQVEKQKEYWWTFLQNHEAARKAGDNARLLLDSLPTGTPPWPLLYGESKPFVPGRSDVPAPPFYYGRPVMPSSSPLSTNPKETSLISPIAKLEQLKRGVENAMSSFSSPFINPKEVSLIFPVAKLEQPKRGAENAIPSSRSLLTNPKETSLISPVAMLDIPPFSPLLTNPKETSLISPVAMLDIPPFSPLLTNPKETSLIPSITKLEQSKRGAENAMPSLSPLPINPKEISLIPSVAKLEQPKIGAENAILSPCGKRVAFWNKVQAYVYQLDFLDRNSWKSQHPKAIPKSEVIPYFAEFEPDSHHVWSGIYLAGPFVALAFKPRRGPDYTVIILYFIFLIIIDLGLIVVG